MSFKYSVIGDNTAENREHLEMVGYEKLGAIKGKKYLITDLSHYAGSMVLSGYPLIDCTGNDPLFRALTAVRDDNDYMQLFTNGVHWYLCETELFGNSGLFNIDKGGSDWHKATKEELVEHFK